jgi:CO/xanthine dehydrogenase Mo-binding subunit
MQQKKLESEVRDMSKELRVIGSRVPIKDARLKVTGHLKYTEDMKIPGMLHGKMIYSEKAHARIISIDTKEAEKLEGVEAIITCFDTPDIAYNSARRFYRDKYFIDSEYVFSQTARFVGDRIAAVAAIDVRTAEKAARLIKVVYEELPAVFDVNEATREGAVQLHENIPNAVKEYSVSRGNLEEGFASADRIYEDEYQTPIVYQAAMENHAAIADYDPAGKLTVYSTTQSVFGVRIVLAKIFGLPMTKVRVIKPPLGGAFGGKIPAILEPVAAALSIKTGKPVKLALKRKEDFFATRTRHGARAKLKTGVMLDGTIVAQKVEVLFNTGAYVGSGTNVAEAMIYKGMETFNIPNMTITGIPVLTNLPNAGAMRGYGGPQYFLPQQMQLNKIAKDLGVDMTDMLLMNLVEADPENIELHGNPRPKDCVLRGMELFDWKRRSMQKSESEGTKRRGVGMALGCHGNGVYPAHQDFITLILKMNEDGTFNLLTGVHDMGNGLPTAQMMIVAEELGIQPKDIETVESDTDVTPWNLGDYASRGIFVTGSAALRLGVAMREKIFDVAASMLKTDRETLRLGSNGAIISESGTVKEFCEILQYYHEVHQKDLVVVESYASEAGRTSFGAHFADVEVDLSSGEVKVLDYVAVHDVGKVINRLSIEGQLEGGIQMGLGYALSESMDFDESGKLINSNLKKYKIFKAEDMPQITCDFIEMGEDKGPYGAKSIGECATTPSAPAVANAVVNALNEYKYELPIRAEHIMK